MSLNFHEELNRELTVQGSSDRQFGLVIGVALLAAGCWPLRFGQPVRLPAIGAAVVFLALAAIRPSSLHFLNKLWTRLGLLLGRIVSPIVTGLLFFLVFTPVGVISRMAGRDALRLRRDPGASTYWIERTPPGPRPETMVRQF